MRLTPAGPRSESGPRLPVNGRGGPPFSPRIKQGRPVVLEDQEVGLAILIDVEGLDGGGNGGHAGKRDRLDLAPLRGPKRPRIGLGVTARSSNVSLSRLGLHAATT